MKSIADVFHHLISSQIVTAESEDTVWQFSNKYRVFHPSGKKWLIAKQDEIFRLRLSYPVGSKCYLEKRREESDLTESPARERDIFYLFMCL